MTKAMVRWEWGAIGRRLLRLREAPIPSPRPGEMLVKVAPVALNYRDKMVIESGRGLPLAFPFTPGSDFAGTIVALGDDVSRFIEGELVISTFTPDWIDGTRPGNAGTPSYRTMGGFYPGVLAEYVAFPEEVIVSGSADKRARARALGADHVVDRRSEDWVEVVLAITGDHAAAA